MTLALVIGCAEGVWQEVEEAERICGEFAAVYCVKLAGVHWPKPFKAWVGLHPEYMIDYIRQRKELGYPNGYEVVTALEVELGKAHGKVAVDRRVPFRWNPKDPSGSSGLFGVKVALDDGYRVVCAGIPMDGSNHFLRGKPWVEGRSQVYVKAWVDNYQRLKPVVRSMSGFTQKLLGAPTAEWVAGSRLESVS